VRTLAKETLIASGLYLAAFLVVFEVVTPLQSMFFPEFPSRASLLFLPHGIRVLTAWLLGWRAIPALLPGVFLVFLYVGGMDVFLPSRLIAIAIAVTVAPAVFMALAFVGQDIRPQPGKTPCWPCVMGVGIVTSVLMALLTNMAFGSETVEYVAYLIGDIFGLFFLMLGLLYIFRYMRRNSSGN
jgi:hypothetical protein